MIQSRKLKIKTPELNIQTHPFIEFKHYTGNEILYTIKDFSKLKPGEISSALLQLGLRRGLPADFDWNSHPSVQALVTHLNEQVPRYTCRVLTSLAHALSRLKLVNDELWDKLAVHILRTVTSIEPIGLAYCFSAFEGKNKTSFYRDLCEILPVHLPLMKGQEVMHVIKGIVQEKLDDEVLYDHVLKFVIGNIKEFNISQLEKIHALCKGRKRYDEEFGECILASIKKKLSRFKVVSFGGKEIISK